MALPLAKAELIGTLLAMIFYGMYLVISLRLFRLLYARLQAGRRALYLLATAVLIFSLIPVYLALQAKFIIEGFTGHMDVANAPITYYRTLNIWTRLVETSIYMGLMLVCDGILVYRVFVIYERKYVWIIIPSVFFLADVALSARAAWAITNINSKNIAVKGSHNQFNYFYAITLALNVLCTVMISWKIWAIHSNVPGPVIAGVRFMGVVTVIVESAVVYSCILIAIIMENALGTTGLWIFFNSVPPTVGIIFSAVMVRASREYHSDTLMSVELSLPTHRSPHHTTYSDHQETDPRSSEDIVAGQTIRIPPAARKRSSLTFHISTSPRQASHVDAIKKGHPTLEVGT